MPLTIISNLTRFDLGFWQASKQIYRKFKYKENKLNEFQRLPGFSRKLVLYSYTKLGILKPWTLITNLKRFDLGFWQASKQIYRKLKHTEKDLEEFQGLPRFASKMVLYLSSNFRILKPLAIVSRIIRFDLDLCQASKPIYKTLRYRENNFEEFQCLPPFPRKMVLYPSAKFGF